jgi:cell division septal protein FtsQ
MPGTYDYSKKRIANKRKSVVTKKRSKKPMPSQSMIYGIGFLLAIIILVTLITRLLTSEYFRIKKITYLGEKSITQEELDSKLSEFYSKNIIITRRKSIVNTLLDEYVYFKEVKVRKIWPDELIISINERQPQLSLINFNGAYVVDEDSRIIEVISQENINLSNDDLVVIKGLGNPDSIYIEKIIKAKWQEDNPDLDIKDFDFNTIPYEDKIKTLEDLKNTLTQKANDQLAHYSSVIADSKYSKLQFIKIYENKNYQEFDFINPEVLNLSSEVSKFFINDNLDSIADITWQGDYLMVITLNSGKQLIFGTHRDVAEQLEDYMIVRTQLELNGNDYSKIDLSSRKISVR